MKDHLSIIKTLKLIKNIESDHGHIDIWANSSNDLLLAKPFGYISPALVQKDLHFLKSYDGNRHNEWSYYVDISKVKRIHPLNPFYLRRLRTLKNMNTYVVYTPSKLLKTVMLMGSWISSPDQIITDRKAFQRLVNG